MSKTFTDWLVEQTETIDESSKVTINSPGHRLHGKVATVFHKHEDGRINVQVQHSQKKGDVTNLTLKPGQFNESVEQLAEDSKRVEIDKKEYDSIAAKHTAAEKNNRTGKYANATCVYDDKEKNNGLKRGVVHQTYSHDVHKLPTIETGGGKHYKFVKESVELEEGKWTVNAKTGAKLDPKTGAAIPGTSKAEITLQKALAKTQRPVAAKPDLDKIWRKVEEVVGRIYPDGDPIDWLGPWMKQQGWDYSFVEKAAKKHGYKDVYDYWDSMGDDLGYNESVEQIEELSKSTLGSYIKRAVASKEDSDIKSTELGYNAAGDASHAKSKKRMFGIRSAVNKLTKESEEQIEEAIKQSDFLAYAEPSNKGFRPTVAHKADPNRIMYSAGVHYKTKDAAKSHAEEYLKGYADKGANEADRRVWKFRSANTHNIAGMNESEELDEVVSPFDWKKYTAQTNKPEGNSGVHKGTYGSEDHKAKGDGTPEEKKGRGRPKGEYGSYKIDKAKRDDPEYKKQLSAKVMAAKAENFKIRKEFKDSMNDAIKKHQLKLAGLDK